SLGSTLGWPTRGPGGPVRRSRQLHRRCSEELLMLSAPSPAELLKFLQEHGFLTPRQVQQLGAGSGMKFADSRALARELIVRDWLTTYQANPLLHGRGAELVLGPYRLVDRLGAGGMGQVFKARHVRIDRIVALKMIPKDRVSNPMALGRFYREVRAESGLSS